MDALLTREKDQLHNVRLEAPTHRPVPPRLYVWGVGVLVVLVTVLVLP